MGTVIGGLGILDAPDALVGVAELGICVLLFALLVFMLVRASSRWFAVGVIAGTAVLGIVAAGACVALVSSYSG